MLGHYNMRFLMFRPFLMSRHCCCDVATLRVDVALLVRLCSDFMTLTYDVATLLLSTAV